MTVTPEELELMSAASELADLAGLDPNSAPALRSRFTNRAEELLREWKDRGHAAGREAAMNLDPW